MITVRDGAESIVDHYTDTMGDGHILEHLNDQLSGAIHLQEHTWDDDEERWIKHEFTVERTTWRAAFLFSREREIEEKYCSLQWDECHSN